MKSLLPESDPSMLRETSACSDPSPARRGRTLLFASGALLALGVGLSAGRPLLPGAEVAAPLEEDELALRAYELLELECLECHGGRRTKASLSLKTREQALRGGDRGSVLGTVVDEEPLLLAMLSYADEDHQMPPSGKLPDEDLELFAAWVEAGLPYPEGLEEAGDAEESHAEEEGGPRVPARGDGLEGWAYRSLERPTVPALAAHPVDAFLAERLSEAGLEPVAEADPLDFVRRATFDLTGLPPTPERIDRFVSEWTADRDAAVAGLIDELLASEAYGEKWARYWLDLVRYAETNGFERDTDKPHIWRYRDWVVDAMNRDLPYDRFVRAQLAGDEIAARAFEANGAPRAQASAAALAEGDDDYVSNLVATGYYRIVQWDDEPGQGRLQARYDTLGDILATTGEAFLGTTIGCARCHDHPADPISHAEYYSLLSFLHGVTDMSVGGFVQNLETLDTEPERQAARERKEARLAELRAELARVDDALAAHAEEAARGSTRAPSGLGAVRWRLYRDTFDGHPAFDELRHEEEGTLDGDLFSLEPRSRDEAIGFVQEGRLHLPALGGEGARPVEFRLQGGDTVRLLVGDQVVLAADRAEGGRRKGTVELTPGDHAVRVEWTHALGSPQLSLSWRPLPAIRWRAREEAPAADWRVSTFDDADWTEGAPGFGRASTPGARVGTPWLSSDLWLRGRFAWGGSLPDDLALVVHHDEDVAVWINGVPALQREGYRTDYAVFDPDPAARAALALGDNVLAVHARQTVGGQYVDVVPVSRASLVGRGLDDVLGGWMPLSVDALVTEDVPRGLDATGAQAERKEERGRLQRKLDEVQRRPLPGTRVAAVQERGREPAQLHVHVRGNAAVLGDPVEPALPAVLGGDGPLPIAPLEVELASSGRRTALARWITDPANPLTARVHVNRIWQHHFGRGLVASPSDFGELGERPTHPELLDWLATEFVANGWSTKAMHRLLMTSAAYRRGSAASEDALAIDPMNLLYWRFPLKRLTAEEVRDAMLAVSGELNPKRGGPSFFEPVSRDVLATSSKPNSVWGRSPEEETLRRSLYIKVKRSLRPPMLVAFDAADTDVPCAARFETVQPSQALTLLNSAFARARAAGLATRTLAEAGDDDRARAALARRLALGREATPAELDDDLAFLRELREEEGLDDAAAWEDLSLLIYNLSEFVYLD